MPYVPNNVSVYASAYAGAITGMGVSNRIPSSAVSASYALLAAQAGAWAEEFDTLWGLAAASSLDLSNIQSCSGAVWESRAPTPVAPFFTAATYAAEVASLVAIVQAAQTWFTGQAIVPPPAPVAVGPATAIALGTVQLAGDLVGPGSVAIAPRVLLATTLVKGIIQLAGDFGGTAALPTVIAAAAGVQGKVALSGDLAGAGSTAATPRVVAATAGVTGIIRITGDLTGTNLTPRVVDATAAVQGRIQLAGDLAGSGSASSSPRVKAVTGIAGVASNTVLNSFSVGALGPFGSYAFNAQNGVVALGANSALTPGGGLGLIATDAGDNMLVGDTSNGTVDVSLDSVNQTNLKVAAVTVASVGPLGFQSGQAIAVTNATVDLTLLQYNSRYLEIQGAQSAQRDYRPPVTFGRQWIVRNATTGGFGVRIIGASGTGIVIASARSATVGADGTNIIRLTPDTVNTP